MKKVILIFAAIILLLSTTKVTGKTLVIEVPTQIIHTHTRIQKPDNFSCSHQMSFIYDV